MLQLINLSNFSTDNEMFDNCPDKLQAFLNRHNLDGIEMMFCAPWNSRLHKAEWLHGCHLRFWPWWLDFWRGNQHMLLKQFGSQEAINDCYGGPTRDAWLEIYRNNIITAQQAGVKYLVFHVSNARPQELFHWQFGANSKAVITATLEVVKELAPVIAPDTALLFENLWWPGLTLADPELTAMLLDKAAHPNVGIMLDVGHLMNTNPELKTEEEGAEYVIKVLDKLGSYRHYIRGVHLHKSLSGKYVHRSQATKEHKMEYTAEEIMNHVIQIDQHQPFTTVAAQQIINHIEPDFVVHEFIPSSLADLEQKLRVQQQAITIEKMAI